MTPQTLAGGFVYLEGPRWHQGRLWMSDMFAGKVYALAPDGAVEVVAEVPGRPSGIGFLPDGTPLIVSMRDRRVLRLEAGALTVHADLGALVTGDPNDMVVDGGGRAYVGDFGYDLFAGARERSAKFILVEPDGAARVVARDMAFPNGTVILPDGRLVVAESAGHRLTSFDIAADGSLLNRQIYADISGYEPDGICLDQGGGIWVSAFEQCAFLRVLEGGQVTNRIDVPGRFAVACQLGGEEGRTLFCLTCEGTWADVCAGRSQAKVEVVEVDVPGAGSP